MQYTDNYDLMKPDLTDKYEVEHQNQNMNIIDGAMKSFDDIVSFEATNLVTNGNFANGATGWWKTGSSTSVLNNVCNLIGSGTDSTVAMNTAPMFKEITHTYYINAKAMVTNDLCSRIDLGHYRQPKYITVNNPIINNWYTVSGIKTGYPTDSPLYIAHTYSTSAIALNKVMQVKDIETIDLTATFGAGNEPTQAQCDIMFAIWKDGTFQISSIATLENNKANRVQEAWITPTLLNSWIPYYRPTYNTCQYMKDEMGFVYLRGMVKSGTTGIIFTLPTGYRPLKTLVNPCLSNNTIGRVDIDASGVVTCIVYDNTYVSLQGICFKAEQ